MSPPPSLESILGDLRDDLAEVERILVDETASIAGLVQDVAAYAFGAGGKRIRPSLVLLGARLFGTSGRRVQRIAACAEWLHGASLLHDDVVDGALTRRGRRSVNARFGVRQAVLVGDFLYAQLCRVLVEEGSREILARFAATIGEMAEGEVLQLERSFEPDVDEQTYLSIIGRKTSSLLATAVESGAILAGAKPDDQRALREYGWQLGIAFQLVDDALDYVGERAELGKAPLTDLAEGKVTGPLLWTLESCEAAERDQIRVELSQLARELSEGRGPDPGVLERVSDAVRRHDGVEATLRRARSRADEAISQLQRFDDGPPLRALEGLAEFVVARHS